MPRPTPRTVAVAALLAALCAPASAVELRIVAANISSGPLQSYPSPGPGARILQALDPDVVLIQEFNVNATRSAANDDAAVRAWVDDVLGSDYHWFREPGGDAVPNGVISRWPIVAAGEWRDPVVSNRDFAFARLDIPGPTDLWVVSVHLLTRGSGVRDLEARELAAQIERHVPPGDYLVVGGDLNTDRRNEPAIATLGRLLDVLGPFPHDGADPPDGDTNRSRRKPYDWVLADADLESLARPTRVGELEFPHGLVFDSRIFTQAELDESFPPVRRDDCGAPQMQHMAVVRDFDIPDGTGEPQPDFELAASSIDFGRVDADAGSVVVESLGIAVRRPFQLLAAAFAGSHAQEFSLVEPDLATGTAAVEDDRRVSFAWAPAANDGLQRSVVATLVTDGEPGAVEVELRGLARASPSAGEPLDLTGFRIEQSGDDASLTLPPGTLLAPGGLLVIGRDATRAEFEAFWGALDPAVLYLDGSELAGEPGFPIVNGDERYRLVDPEGVALDPAAWLPPGAMDRRRSRERLATDATAFLDRDQAAATPGRFGGHAAGTGRPVLTEVSDAPQFRFEFLELLNDVSAADETPEE